MNRPKPWAATAAVGFVLLGVSVVMAFLADHHWYLGYEPSLVMGRWFWMIQGAGIVALVVGSIGLLLNMRPKMALLIGVALIMAGFLMLFMFGWEVLNVHNWRFVLLLPVLVFFLGGTAFGVAGLLRFVLVKRTSNRRA